MAWPTGDLQVTTAPRHWRSNAISFFFLQQPSNPLPPHPATLSNSTSHCRIRPRKLPSGSSVRLPSQDGPSPQKAELAAAAFPPFSSAPEPPGAGWLPLGPESPGARGSGRSRGGRPAGSGLTRLSTPPRAPRGRRWRGAPEAGRSRGCRLRTAARAPRASRARPRLRPPAPAATSACPRARAPARRTHGDERARAPASVPGSRARASVGPGAQE